MTSGLRQKIDSEALKIGLLLKHEFTTNQYATIINLVKARLGLSIVPKSISNVALDRGLCVKRLPQSLHRKIAILVQRTLEEDTRRLNVYSLHSPAHNQSMTV